MIQKWPIPIVPDSDVPENEIQLRQDGKVVGRIIVSTDDQPIGIEVDKAALHKAVSLPLPFLPYSVSSEKVKEWARQELKMELIRDVVEELIAKIKAGENPDDLKLPVLAAIAGIVKYND